MISKEEMKNSQTGQFDTASSDFYSPPNYTPSNFTLERSNSISQPCSIEQLEQQLARVREIMATSQELYKRLQSNQELKKYVEETQEELQVVRARAMNEQNNLKMSFEKNYSSLEREMAAYRKNWKAIKEGAQNQMEEEVAAFRESIQKDKAQLKKVFGQTTSDIKAKSAAVCQELRETKKMRKESTATLMGLVEQARNKFQMTTEQERKRRNEYESIVLGLLDRTVDQGEKLMRRIG